MSRAAAAMPASSSAAVSPATRFCWPPAKAAGWLRALGAVFAAFAAALAVYLWDLSRILGYRDD